jgi:glycosyltransferase involved in cell wall biosynthesis
MQFVMNNKNIMTTLEWRSAKLENGVLMNKFVIVIPFYNAEETIEQAVLTSLNQNFDDLAIVIRNDISTDRGGYRVRNIFGIKQSGNFYIKSAGRDVIYIENTKKLYGGGNTYDSVIHLVNSRNAIIGVVDGDDFLLTADAVSTIYKAYQDHPDKWMIWSQHMSRVLSKNYSKGFSLPLPPDHIIYRTRRYWGVSHFRTCLAGLFSHIDPADLSDPYDKDSYAKVCGDAAIIYPLTELCGNKHSLFLNQPLYYYNDGLPSNDAEVYKSELQFYKYYFECKDIYAPLIDDYDFDKPLVS